MVYRYASHNQVQQDGRLVVEAGIEQQVLPLAILVLQVLFLYECVQPVQVPYITPLFTLFNQRQYCRLSLVGILLECGIESLESVPQLRFIHSYYYWLCLAGTRR